MAYASSLMLSNILMEEKQKTNKQTKQIAKV